jgi:hypothetical protein
VIPAQNGDVRLKELRCRRGEGWGTDKLHIKTGWTAPETASEMGAWVIDHLDSPWQRAAFHISPSIPARSKPWARARRASLALLPTRSRQDKSPSLDGLVLILWSVLPLPFLIAQRVRNLDDVTLRRLRLDCDGRQAPSPSRPHPAPGAAFTSPTRSLAGGGVGRRVASRGIIKGVHGGAEPS